MIAFRTPTSDTLLQALYATTLHDSSHTSECQARQFFHGKQLARNTKARSLPAILVSSRSLALGVMQVHSPGTTGAEGKWCLAGFFAGACQQTYVVIHMTREGR